MITNMHRNIMGTLSFDAKFPGMRKSQSFIVYPMKECEYLATIQSDSRIGTIDIVSGAVVLSPSIKGGAYFPHLAFARPAWSLDAETLLMLKAQIMDTASGKAGSNGIVFTDNSGALEVFQ